MKPVKPKIIRATTVPVTMNLFCRGLLGELSRTYEVVAVTSPDEGFDEIGRRERVRCIPVRMRREIAPWHDFAALVHLFYVFRRERPDMVHSFTPKAGLLCMIAAWAARIPLRVHTFTGLLFPTARGLRRRVLLLTDWATCACATHVIAEGEGVRADLRRARLIRLIRKPITVLGNGNVRGVDLTHYSRTPAIVAAAADIRARLGIADDAFTFVFVGRLVPDKGIGELAEAFCHLLAIFPSVHLLLVGWEEAELAPLDDDTARRLAKTEHIHAVGRQEDVRPWYAAADALVFPSHREGFPNVVLEAGAMGLPSIVTDINGSREIITEGINGTIIAPSDTTGLLAAMCRFVADPQAVRTMAEAARPVVAERYEQTYVRHCLIDYYRSLFGA